MGLSLKSANNQNKVVPYLPLLVKARIVRPLVNEASVKVGTQPFLVTCEYRMYKSLVVHWKKFSKVTLTTGLPVSKSSILSLCAIGTLTR